MIHKFKHRNWNYYICYGPQPILKYMKKTYCLSLLAIILVIASFSSKAQQYNIPPGNVLPMKVDTRADYWHKLDLIPEGKNKNAKYDDFLKELSKDDLSEMKANNKPVYDYYMEAKTFHNNLSDRVKVTFTWDELWEIYMFNPELKNELISIE